MTLFLMIVLVLVSVECRYPSNVEVKRDYSGRSGGIERREDQRDAKKYKPEEMETRIVGGKYIGIEESPSYVVVRIEMGGQAYICTGNLVTTSHALTAAHCVVQVKQEIPSEHRIAFRILEPSAVTIRAGSTYSYRGGFVVNVEKVYVNPDYLSHRPTVAFSDVAVLKLDQHVSLGGSVQTAEFYPQMSLNQSEDIRGMKCKVAGWGRVAHNGKLSPHLKQTQVSLIDNDECRLYYLSKVSLEAHICALTPKTDACQGDSGGGLFCEGKLIALTSWGWGCASGSPGVYARVDNQQDFIREAILKAHSVSVSVLLVPLLTLTTLLL